MRPFLLLVLVCLALGCGCGTSSTPAADGGQDAVTVGDGGKLPFGATCTEGSQCESGACIAFGQGTWCTIACTDASQCPSGSQGQKCNLQGYCRP